VVGKNLVHSLSRSERRELIDWENREWSVKTQAQLLSLNRSGLDYQPKPPSAEEVAFKHRIDEIYTRCPYYGYRKVTEQMHCEGHAINQKTVAQYMREMGLIAVYPGPN
jgi:putative transposase